MKNNFKLNIPILIALLFALALLIGGCGGSGSGTSSGTSLTSGKSVGQAKVSIKWPARAVAGKLIPVASNSIVITLSFDGSVVGTQTVANPGNGGTTSVFFPNLPVGQVGVTATAYPNADGTGTAQATGSSTIAITNGGTASITLTMGSTIASLSIGPSFTNPLSLGATQTLTVQALDASGDVVLVTPTNFSWSSSNPAVATVTSPGATSVLTAASGNSGDTTITVTESDSNVSATLAVQVRGPVTSLQITAITPAIYMGATMQFTLIATDAYGNQVANPPGLNWTSSSPEVAQIGATKGNCQAEVNGTTQETTVITASATGVAPSSSVLTVLPGTGAGSFLSPHTVTLNGNTPQQFVIYSGNTQANSVVWSIPAIANSVGSLGSIDGNGVYTAPAQAPQVNTIPQNVTVQGVSGGQTFTSVVTIN